MTRSCSPRSQGYVSTGRGLTLTQSVKESTAVAGLEWTVQYEFVTVAKDGPTTSDDNDELSCDREFRSDHAGGGYITMQEYAVSTPRNVFLYGRGGQENISCSLRFSGSDNQRIQIKFSNISMGSSSSCKTVFDASLNQFRCERSSGETGVLVSEVMSEPWSQQQCHCQVMSRSGQVMTSVSNNIIVTFRATKMLPSQDFRDFLMQGSFRFIPTHCQHQTLEQGGGRVTLDYHGSDQSICDRRSWSVRARPGHQIFLQFSGTLVTPDQSHMCQGPSRVVVRTAGTMFVICPGDPGPVSLVSPVSEVDQQLASVSVQLAGQPGHHRQLSFSWLEMRPLLQVSALTTDQSHDHCSHVCPSLHSCIHSSLWCDGVNNCPDGADEAQCPHLLVPLYYFYTVLGAALLIFLITALVLICRLKSCGEKKQEAEVVKRISNGTVETMLNHKVYSSGTMVSSAGTVISSSGTLVSGSTVGGGSVDWSLTSCPDILDHGQFSAPCPPQFQDPGVS